MPCIFFYWITSLNCCCCCCIYSSTPSPHKHCTQISAALGQKNNKRCLRTSATVSPDAARDSEKLNTLQSNSQTVLKEKMRSESSKDTSGYATKKYQKSRQSKHVYMPVTKKFLYRQKNIVKLQETISCRVEFLNERRFRNDAPYLSSQRRRQTKHVRLKNEGGVRRGREREALSPPSFFFFARFARAFTTVKYGTLYFFSIRIYFKNIEAVICEILRIF